MARLRIALLGSASAFTGRALEELAGAHEVVACFRARPGGGFRGPIGEAIRRMRPSPLEESARRLGIPVHAKEGDELAERLRAARPDLLCISLYPRRVGADAIACASLGAINVHPSLLPRHRGPLPLFWTYHADDRETGVTVHHASARLDAGEIVLQERFALARGYPVASLDADMALCAARLLRAGADAVASGHAVRRPQDESCATAAPLVHAGQAMVDFDAWDFERVWHFLAGLAPRWREPLVDTAGRPVRYERVLGYRSAGSAMAPGTVARAASGLHLHCRGGVVELA